MTISISVQFLGEVLTDNFYILGQRMKAINFVCNIFQDFRIMLIAQISKVHAKRQKSIKCNFANFNLTKYKSVWYSKLTKSIHHYIV